MKQDMAGDEDLTLCVLGGSPECWNLGVSALGTSAIARIRKAFPACRCMIQTFGMATETELRMGNESICVDAVQVWDDPRPLSPRGIWQVNTVGSLARRLGSWVAIGNGNLRRLLRSDAFLDVSGGDSFAEIYGAESFAYQVAMKLLARDLGKKLVLLPQTYGPFESQSARRQACEIIDYASVVATRDWSGPEIAARELGETAAAKMVRCPDMAFTLEPVPVPVDREAVLLTRQSELTIGLNVSGLLAYGKRRFGIEHSHMDLCRALAAWAVERCHARLVLVPHVISGTPPEQALRQSTTASEVSDTRVCLELHRELNERYGDRVMTIGWPYGPGETKYLIGHCDFLVGARMHACIAGVSQCVPTVTLAYSRKAAGVMAHAGVGDCVLDLRGASIEQAVREIDRVFARREEVSAHLRQRIPAVQAEVSDFFCTTMAAALGVEARRDLRPARFGGPRPEGGRQ